MVAGHGVTLLPEVAIDVEVRDERVKLLRFVEPQPRRNIGLAWRPTSPRKGPFPVELPPILPETPGETVAKSQLNFVPASLMS